MAADRCPAFSLHCDRIRFIWIDTVFRNSLRHHRRIDLAIIGQGFQRSDRDIVPIHLEKFAQLGTCIGTTKTIRTEYTIATTLRYEWTNLLGIAMHVISRRNYRPVAASQLLCDIRHTLLLRSWVEKIPAICILTLACQQGKGWC